MENCYKNISRLVLTKTLTNGAKMPPARAATLQTPTPALRIVVGKISAPYNHTPVKLAAMANLPISQTIVRTAIKLEGNVENILKSLFSLLFRNSDKRKERYTGDGVERHHRSASTDPVDHEVESNVARQFDSAA